MTDPHDDHHRKGILEQLDEDEGHGGYARWTFAVTLALGVIAGVAVIWGFLWFFGETLAPFGAP